MSVQLEPVAILRSPYKQKFAIPRQPNLVREAIGEIVFAPAYADVNVLRGIEGFSHLWLLFLFHETAAQGWNPTVTPPRLGGSEKVGVFASRSTFRPNALGLSVVEFVDYEQRGRELVLRVRGIDLLDGTPIVDIKPYLPYADAVPDATGGYAPDAPVQQLSVEFSDEAREQLTPHLAERPELERFIVAVLQQDPRPAVHVRQAQERAYAMFLYELNVRWRVDGMRCIVTAIEMV
ncbi:MAG: tRNA (N6-threonylcarbamoyladenosine(37)-N6)-methyltransferase TrmO [Pseudomonadota bacterium]|nr:tRNA (N6-threonylcarbamoyladenosine(37)-N6)-methyltransferase TrmO [Pseudomonadota bacterium]